MKISTDQLGYRVVVRGEAFTPPLYASRLRDRYLKSMFSVFLHLEFLLHA
jgi:hypothetical protein